jgi:hypothetical protein
VLQHLNLDLDETTNRVLRRVVEEGRPNSARLILSGSLLSRPRLETSSS